jgi:microsomal dipeptidase-like Zn-dependent dipeptidase
MGEASRVEIFDGHNDAVQFVMEYRDGGRDFLARSDDGHLDLPRARDGGMVGGLFAMFAKPERPPEGDFTRTENGYEVRLAEPLDPAYARQRIDAQLDALSRLEARAAGQIRFVSSADEIETAVRDGVFAVVLHMEGAEAIGPDLGNLERLYAAGLRSLGLVWSRPNIFVWGAFRLSALAGHWAGPHRGWDGSGAGVQRPRGNDRCITPERTRLLGCGGIDHRAACGNPRLRPCNLCLDTQSHRPSA